ncbi:MAG: DsbA family protein [Actinobacteria bacterium]|nr:MAG: DsbA family protein [Actinomycetota bacterium]
MTDLRSSAPPPLDDSDHVRGPTEAPLLLLYGDFACPSCALADRRLRRLPLRYAFRHFALRSKRPRALALACASEAAARQGAFWPMHDALFDDQGHQDDPHLWRRAQALGLDLERFEADRRAEVTAARVARDVTSGLRAGVALTPTLFVGGERHAGPPTPELLEALAAGIARAGRGEEPARADSM